MRVFEVQLIDHVDTSYNAPIQTDYCYADDQAHAKSRVNWRYGHNIEIVSVTLQPDLADHRSKWIW